jgi:hypothetical protein
MREGAMREGGVAEVDPTYLVWAIAGVLAILGLIRLMRSRRQQLVDTLRQAVDQRTNTDDRRSAP